MPVLDSGRIITRLRAAFNHDATRVDLLAMAARQMHEAGSPYTSVYCYMLHGDELVLEASSGRETEHTRIPIGRGICGTAVVTREDQNVGDVRARPEYIACSVATRAELVVLIRRGQLILGQIDVDSDQPDPFNSEEEAAVRDIADALAVLL